MVNEKNGLEKIDVTGRSRNILLGCIEHSQVGDGAHKHEAVFALMAEE
jgi:hypothetical protein